MQEGVQKYIHELTLFLWGGHIILTKNGGTGPKVIFHLDIKHFFALPNSGGGGWPGPN